MASVRQDIAKLGDIWNPTMEWYARAMGAMWVIPLQDRRGWRYLAAIHGTDLTATGWPSRGAILQGDALPAGDEAEQMWNQCEHGTWYFLPWHRGYVAAFEAIVAQKVKELGGPADWKLPYWNYLDMDNPAARRIPAAFSEPVLPDGSGNPLAQFARSATGMLTTLTTDGQDIDLKCMALEAFTANPGAAGFGGSPSGADGVGASGGAMESNPHNLIHVMAGGLGGFLSDPAYAALDPLFWVHHCNIDRLWSAWLARDGNTQENSAQWREGEAPRQFLMPQPDGTLQRFYPRETLPGERLDPKYDDLVAGTTDAPTGAIPAVVGGAVMGNAMPARLSDKPPAPAQLLGSNTQSLQVAANAAVSRIKLSGPAVPAGLAPKRYYAVFENVRGDAASSTLAVSVGLPGGSVQDALRADTAVLFGLAKASTSHGANGLNVSVEITDQVARLAIQHGAMPDELEVHVQQAGPLAMGTVTVGKTSIVSQDT